MNSKTARLVAARYVAAAGHESFANNNRDTLNVVRTMTNDMASKLSNLTGWEFTVDEFQHSTSWTIEVKSKGFKVWVDVSTGHALDESGIPTTLISSRMEDPKPRVFSSYKEATPRFVKALMKKITSDSLATMKEPWTRVF